MEGLVLHHFHVHHLVSCRFGKDALGLADGDLFLFHFLGHHVGNHHGNLVRLLVVSFRLISFVFHFDFDGPMIQVAIADASDESISSLLLAFIHRCIFGRVIAKDNIHRATIFLLLGGPHDFRDALDGFLFGIFAMGSGFFLLHQPHGFFGEIADHGLYVAAYITHFGVFRGFHFYKRRMSQRSDAASDLRLAHAGGTHEENILRAHFLRHFR